MAVRPKPVRPFAPRGRATPAAQTRLRGDAAVASWQTSAPPSTSPRVARSSSAGVGLSRSGGDVLLLVFFAATVIMVVAVVLVGAVGQWWVLMPVMLVHLLATVAVIVAIVQLLGTDG